MQHSFEFDFDYWMKLNKDDPDVFEDKRKKLLDQFIENSFHHKRRIQGLQFKIDMERRKARSAMGSCIRLSDLMKDYFQNEFIAAVNTFNFPSEK